MPSSICSFLGFLLVCSNFVRRFSLWRSTLSNVRGRRKRCCLERWGLLGWRLIEDSVQASSGKEICDVLQLWLPCSNSLWSLWIVVWAVRFCVLLAWIRAWRYGIEFTIKTKKLPLGFSDYLYQWLQEGSRTAESWRVIWLLHFFMFPYFCLTLGDYSSLYTVQIEVPMMLSSRLSFFLLCSFCALKIAHRFLIMGMD